MRISQSHPNFAKINQHVLERFHSEFNNIALDVVEKYFDNCLFDAIIIPTISVLRKEWWGDLSNDGRADIEEEYNLDEGMYMPDDRTYDSFEDWLEEIYCNDIHDHFAQANHYPMWGTLFESKSSFTDAKILQFSDELYDFGIGVIHGRDSLNNMLFINGCGYDFYEAHWIPMMEMFGWIPDEMLESE